MRRTPSWAWLQYTSNSNLTRATIKPGNAKILTVTSEEPVYRIPFSQNKHCTMLKNFYRTDIVSEFLCPHKLAFAAVWKILIHLTPIRKLRWANCHQGYFGYGRGISIEITAQNKVYRYSPICQKRTSEINETLFLKDRNITAGK